jgi:hypothetical protein
MITYGCPQCRGTIHSPETEIGKTLECPHCKTAVVVPAGAKSNTGVIIGVLSALMVVLIGCPLLIVVCLAAISVLGQKASGTFTSVGGSMTTITRDK